MGPGDKLAHELISTSDTGGRIRRYRRVGGGELGAQDQAKLDGPCFVDPLHPGVRPPLATAMGRAHAPRPCARDDQRRLPADAVGRLVL
jgi:hypothetical protein